MAITLYHHPFSRAAGAVWFLEEVGVDYQLEFVDFMKGDNKRDAFKAINPMGKLPTLVDGETVVTESAAIALYLADRYAPGKLAPALDDPKRGTYLRWSLFAPSVIEPGSMAKAGNWDVKPTAAGWGTYDEMIAAISSAVTGKRFLLGDQFSMADCIFGGTLRYMSMFKMIEPRPEVTEYLAHLDERPALKRADAKNMEVMTAHGLKLPGA